MDAKGHFSPDYRTARDKFLEVTAAAGARIETFENPAPGPDGDPVYTDVALIGEPDADRVLLVNTATHGVEGFCGSGLLVGWLRSGAPANVPGNTRVVLIHALNPHGFAWVRRVTEDNVDLNRNFIDHEGTRPGNPAYAELHSHLVPKKWTKRTIKAAQTACDAYAAKNGGDFAAQAAIIRGQYDYEDGLFFGGKAPTWSNRTYRSILDRFVKGASKVAVLDIHTGLGPYGTAMLIGGARSGSPLSNRLLSWYGDGLASSAAGSTPSPPVSGTLGSGLRQTLSDVEITSVTVEFGTYAVPEVLHALMADNWLHLHGDPDSPLGKEIKADIRRRLYPDEDDWKEMVYLRGTQILRRAIRGLSSG